MSWGKCTPYHAERIHGYPQAVRFFQQRGPVRSRHWAANERPLISTTERWFKLRHLAEEDVFELLSNDDAVIRYEKPLANGNYTVLLNKGAYKGHEFLYYANWATWSSSLATTGGQQVYVPLSYETDETSGIVPKGFSAKLVFNKKDQLLLGQSDHRPALVRCSTEGDKKMRKRLRQTLATILDLLVLRLPTFHAEGEISTRKGRAFGGMQFDLYRVAALTQGIAAHGKELNDDALEVLIPYAQEVYNVSLSKWLHALPGDDSYYQEYSTGGWRQRHEAAQFPPLAGAAFRASLKSAFLRHSGLDKQSGWVLLPKFPTEPLPNKYWFGIDYEKLAV